MTENRNLSDSRSQTGTRNELLEKRMLMFAVNIIQILENHKQLPRSVMDQITRSATSIGANYAEACNASSKMDFRNKIYIAKKEAAETRYWIDLCFELTKSTDWSDPKEQSQELLMILQSIINSLRGKSDK